jgi:hypothetical protein
VIASGGGIRSGPGPRANAAKYAGVSPPTLPRSALPLASPSVAGRKAAVSTTSRTQLAEGPSGRHVSGRRQPLHNAVACGIITRVGRLDMLQFMALPGTTRRRLLRLALRQN